MAQPKQEDLTSSSHTSHIYSMNMKNIESNPYPLPRTWMWPRRCRSSCQPSHSERADGLPLSCLVRGELCMGKDSGSGKSVPEEAIEFQLGCFKI